MPEQRLTAGVPCFGQAVHLPASQGGLGLGIAGFVSPAAGVAVARLADTRGARGVYATTLVVQAPATAGFVPAHGFWPFALAVCAATPGKVQVGTLTTAWQHRSRSAGRNLDHTLGRRALKPRNRAGRTRLSPRSAGRAR